MDYPVYIDGVRRGTLTVTQEGIRKRFTARCEMLDGIIRLSVYGQGKSACIGVLCPKNGRLELSKCFTRNEMCAFPEKIEYASNAEMRKESPAQTPSEWIMSTRGCLVLSDGKQKLVAIPADGKRLEKTGLVRNIDGRDYLVFRK